MLLWQNNEFYLKVISKQSEQLYFAKIPFGNEESSTFEIKNALSSAVLHNDNLLLWDCDTDRDCAQNPQSTGGLWSWKLDDTAVQSAWAFENWNGVSQIDINQNRLARIGYANDWTPVLQIYDLSQSANPIEIPVPCPDKGQGTFPNYGENTHASFLSKRAGKGAIKNP